MAITNTDQMLQINGVTLPPFSKYTVQANSLFLDWGRDTNGVASGTFVGYYPKIELEFPAMPVEVYTAIASLLNSQQRQHTVYFWDYNHNIFRTMVMRAEDWATPIISLRIQGVPYVDAWKVALTPNEGIL